MAAGQQHSKAQRILAAAWPPHLRRHLVLAEPREPPELCVPQHKGAAAVRGACTKAGCEDMHAHPERVGAQAVYATYYQKRRADERCMQQPPENPAANNKAHR